MSEMVQLLLVVECASDVRQSLTVALERFDVPCVLLVPPGWRPAAPDESSEATALPAFDEGVCRALVKLIQSHEAAALIANDAAMAQAVAADGCHLDYSDTLEPTYHTARELFGAQAIVGVMPGNTHHMAMTLAEGGADYTGYTVTADPDDQGAELVGWWAEIFESPVVAFTNGDISVCRSAIEAGPPDFLAVPLSAGGDLKDLTAIAKLIEDCGQLPVAAKDAK